MRTIPAALRSAIDIAGSYSPVVKADVYPTRIYFGTVTSGSAGIAGADELGIVDDPMRQDIEYSSISDALVTFFCDGYLKYAIQGGSTITTTSYVSSVKPGVLNSTLYLYDESKITRYGISWSDVDSRSTNPLTQQAQVTPSKTVDVLHAVSSTEAIALLNDGGGFRPLYVSGTSQYEAPFRFMYPIRVISSGSGRTMREQALCSGAAELDNKVFVYSSNQSSGMVEGMYYDKDTGVWSDIFNVLPTDLDVSLCEFRISNVYTHNGTLYMCGLFNRTDNIDDDAQPYSMLLYSQNGKTFSIERNTLVSDIGYRFLARVGNNKLYLGNCNRVCYEAVTWLFDGTSGSGAMATISADDIKSFTDRDLGSGTMKVRAGKEEYFDHEYLEEGSKVVVYLGMRTSTGTDYIVYGTYIAAKINYGIASGKRDTTINLVNLSMWNLTGLSMPFYAELLGKSVMFDPMTEDSGNLSAAGSGCVTMTQFQVDFWLQEPYTNAGESITGIDMRESGGVNYYESSGAHKLGIITSTELVSVLQLTSNPKIMADNIDVSIYGWSHPTSGSVNDVVELVLVTVDDDGNETTTITNEDKHWPNTYPTSGSGNEPITVNITGLTAGDRIKFVGIVFEASVTTWFNIARVEFTSNVEAYYAFPDADSPWERLDDGSFKVPRAGKPFIMHSQRPYNAFDFSLVASFSNTTTGAIAGYGTSCGLVAHSADAANYTLGRYNKTNGLVELVKCRDGIETVLSSGSPGFTVGDEHQIRFDHKGGRFEIFLYDDVAGYFDSALVYEWQDTDGYMFTSRIIPMKCGIYGNIDAPTVRILGYYTGSSETVSNADGMPVDPMFSLDDFPSSGMLRTRENVYNYTGKISHPTLCRGPYQFRQMGVYSPPYGNGSAGLECRDFDWTASTSLINGKLIAINSGANFIANAALWQIYTSTGGVVSWHYNRARYYSANAQIGKVYHTLANKVWVVGGFSGVTLLEGDRVKIAEGELVTYELEGEMKCFWFMGAGGDDDTTIGDLVSRVCDLSGAATSFPGDYTDDAMTVSTEELLASEDYAEGFDLLFEVASFSGTLTLRADAHINSEHYENGAAFEDDTGVTLDIISLGSGVYQYTLYSYPSDTEMYSCVFTTGTGAQKFRVMFVGESIGLYQNGQWVTTITVDDMIYGNSLSLYISHSGSLNLTDIKLRELCDWREAIWIDLETDGRSALSAIIQQRPIETVPQPDGSITFWYIMDRDVVTAVREPREHSYTHSVPVEGASDAIVYGNRKVVTMQNRDFAKHLGLSTKLMRMPDLDIGALKATDVALRKIFEKFRTHHLVIRPDLALVVGDVYSLTYTASGTGRVESHQIIIESVVVEIGMAQNKLTSKMTLDGREVYDE